MWTQIVGKVRLALSPLQAHWWNVPLYVSARGLNTSAMPYGADFLEIEFDFVNHELLFRTSTGLSAYHAAARAIRRRLLHRVPEDPLRPRRPRTHLRHARRSRAPHPLRRGHRPRLLRPRRRAPLLAHPHPDRPGLPEILLALHRQDQPRPFLLGQLRSRRHALLRPTRSAARRRRPHHTRGLLARGHQRRLLARQRRLRQGSLLLLRRTVARQPRCRNHPARASLLGSQPRRVHPPLRRPPRLRLTRRHPARLPAEHLRRRSRPRPLGSQGARARHV